MTGGFNLYSLNTKTAIREKQLVKLPTWIAGSTIILFVIILATVVLFFVNLYFENRLKDRGDYMISLINTQNKSKDMIFNINNYNSKQNAIKDIKAGRLDYEKLISEINTITNGNVISYNIDKNSAHGSIKGVLTDPNDTVLITQQMRDSSTFKSVSLDQLSFIDVAFGYSYNISFYLN